MFHQQVKELLDNSLLKGSRRDERSESPILDKKESITSHNTVLKKTGKGQLAVIAHKCGCNLVWCPKCFKQRGAKTITQKLQRMNYKSTRQVVLTVNPELFNDGNSAHKKITSKRLIASLIRDLERTQNVKVKDWQWVLEWHRNGFPHWHLFIDVTVEGRRGMIGGDTIRHYWKWGSVKEMPIKSKKHWFKITGYFEKHGYFDKRKAHQASLPQWALDDNKTIRRTGGSVKRKPKNNDFFSWFEDSTDEEVEQLSTSIEQDDHLTVLLLGQFFERESKKFFRKSIRELLELCGSQTVIRIGHGHFLGKIDIPYKEFRKIPGEYVDGVGYVVMMNRNDFPKFMDAHRVQSIRRPEFTSKQIPNA
jgi:hypothetical protein